MGEKLAKVKQGGSNGGGIIEFGEVTINNASNSVNTITNNNIDIYDYNLLILQAYCGVSNSSEIRPLTPVIIPVPFYKEFINTNNGSSWINVAGFTMMTGKEIATHTPGTTNYISAISIGNLTGKSTYCDGHKITISKYTDMTSSSWNVMKVKAYLM